MFNYTAVSAGSIFQILTTTNLKLTQIHCRLLVYDMVSVLQTSAIESDILEVDADTKEMLKMLVSSHTIAFNISQY